MAWPSWATFKWYEGMRVRLNEDVSDERFYPEHPLVVAGTEMTIKHFWPHNEISCVFFDERYGGERMLTVSKHKLDRVHL